MSEGAGAWIARFRNGPLAEAEVEHVFVVGPVWRRIDFAPMPATEARPVHWVVVGGDGIGDPPFEQGSLWPGQITYTLAEVVESAEADGSGDPVAWYALDVGVPTPLPPYLWPQPGPLGPEDLRVVPTTAELRQIARVLDHERLAGFAMLTQRDGSPWLEFDVVVPFHMEARDQVRQEVEGLPNHERLATFAHGGTYRFALWRYTGAVYRVGGDGAVEDDPIDLDA